MLDPLSYLVGRGDSIWVFTFLTGVSILLMGAGDLDLGAGDFGFFSTFAGFTFFLVTSCLILGGVFILGFRSFFWIGLESLETVGFLGASYCEEISLFLRDLGGSSTCYSFSFLSFLITG